MASQTIESTTGKGAGEVPLSHVLVRTPAGARRRCDESSTAPGAKGQAMVEMDAGVVETTTTSSARTASSEQQHARLPPQTLDSSLGEPPLITPEKPAPASLNLPPTPAPTPKKNQNQNQNHNPLKRALDSPPDTENKQPSPLTKSQRIDGTSTSSPSPSPNPTPTRQRQRQRHRPTPFRRPAPKFSLAHAANINTRLPSYHPSPSPYHPRSSSSSSKTHHEVPNPNPNPNPNPTTASPSPSYSHLELHRCAESVMAQVDWRLVAHDVAANRSAGVYKRIVRRVLQAEIEGVMMVGLEEDEGE